jgi:hypothetical protein
MSDRAFNRAVGWFFAAWMLFLLVGLPLILEATGRAHYVW